jgi:hypothetical protein
MIRLSRTVLVVVLPLVVVGVAAALAVIRFQIIPQSLDITGYTGRLGEWELTAVLVRTDGAPRELAGPLTMRHVGICTIDGPEERNGEMRARLSTFSSDVVATIVMDGVECSYRGPLSESSSGQLVCPDRRPVPISIWPR